MKKGWIFFILSYLFLASISQAALPPEIRQDLSPLTALVIGLDKDTVILDKGRSQGVRPGDLFTIYRKGKPVIHPETKKVLGYLKTPIAKAEIIRVEENFATGRLLETSESIPVPTPAIRFGDQKILVLGGRAAEKILPELRNILSQSRLILEPGQTLGALSPVELKQQNIDLILLVEKGGLRLYNSRLELIRAYTFPAGPVVSPAPGPTPPTPSTPTVSPPQSRYPYSTLRYSRPTAPMFRKAGRLSQVVIDFEMGDLDGDGQPEVVYLTPKALYVARYRGSLLTTYRYQGFGKILNFSLGPRGWLALNIYVEKEGMRSELLQFTNNQLVVRLKNLNLILSFADFNGDGQNDTLLGQTYSAETFFGPKVYILGRRGDALTYQKELRVPAGFRLLGGTFADVNGDGYLETLFINQGHKLAIYRYTTRLWVSSRKVGGSSYVIKVPAGPYRQTYRMSIPAEVNFLVKDLNGDGRKEVILVANHSTHHDLLPGIPSYSGGEVLVLSYTPTGFELLPLSGNFEGPIQGLGLYGQELFVAISKGNPFTQEGESYLLALPLVMPELKAPARSDVWTTRP